MPRRHSPEVLSPRALARLRSPRVGFVPTERDLDPAAFAPALDGGSVGSSSSSDVWEDGGRHGRAPLGRGRAWVRLPSALVGARWHPGRGAVLGVVIVTLLAV